MPQEFQVVEVKLVPVERRVWLVQVEGVWLVQVEGVGLMQVERVGLEGVHVARDRSGCLASRPGAP